MATVAMMRRMYCMSRLPVRKLSLEPLRTGRRIIMMILRHRSRILEIRRSKGCLDRNTCTSFKDLTIHAARISYCAKRDMESGDYGSLQSLLQHRLSDAQSDLLANAVSTSRAISPSVFHRHPNATFPSFSSPTPSYFCSESGLFLEIQAL